ncbi:YceI family protein [Shewanella sp. SR43-4]|uniref:YceI family protein n=1 Tax=Shewanella vesiculosa TaxID=518738 RepID=A0ABV0FRV9_9GAMM|nr:MULTISPECIES: YceI family protein [Shewanella]NCQ45882.1 YceI family protein [Shewanella frigidimarina]MBB1318998.1 YceI family protein [Shewanella sp. SR43-4]MBB1323387.1 YceI family protein [Shewanella sp. SR43-8]MBB1391358.1 YceI family protein [Shewanella sp. SG44-6]MBB1476140.1 YceI family protein [Shewanella sp. SG41-3]|tara:strand:+ start:9358 stop:9933 length:576 start_codon:yes stop_codon:yes gene_type:complete
MKKWLPLLAASLLSTSVMASDWQVNQDHSRVSFISIKKTDIAEVNHFKHVAGSLTDAGAFSLSIDLTSVDTGVEIRDQRLQSVLFEVAQFPTLTIDAVVNPKLLAGLKVGDTLTTQVEATIMLHGQKQQKSFDVLVAKLSDKKMVVSSLAPVIVQANEFGLVAGVEKLKELAGLPSISLAVPVSFVLTLAQ